MESWPALAAAACSFLAGLSRSATVPGAVQPPDCHNRRQSDDHRLLARDGQARLTGVDLSAHESSFVHLRLLCLLRGPFLFWRQDRQFLGLFVALLPFTHHIAPGFGLHWRSRPCSANRLHDPLIILRDAWAPIVPLIQYRRRSMLRDEGRQSELGPVLNCP